MRSINSFIKGTSNLFRSGKLNNRFKVIWIMDSKLGKHFAIQRNLFFLKTPHESAVVHTRSSGSCRNTSLPKSAKITLLFFATAIRSFPCILHSLHHRSNHATAAAVKSFSSIQITVASTTRFKSSFYSWHTPSLTFIHMEVIFSSLEHQHLQYSHRVEDGAFALVFGSSKYVEAYSAFF